MATITIDGPDLVIDLTVGEQMFALKRSFRVPRALVQDVRWSDDLWRDLPPWTQRGLRVGTSLPGVALYGRLVRRDGTHFVCFGGNPAPGAVIAFKEGAPYRSAMIGCPLLVAEPALS